MRECHEFESRWDVFLRMFKTTLFFLFLFITYITSAQSKVKEWDEAWDKQLKGKLKSIRVRGPFNYSDTYYFKSDKSVFSVINADIYHTGRQIDSACIFSAHFKHDTLLRVVIRRQLPKQKEGSVIMYLDGNKILAQDLKGEVYIPEISKIIERSYQLLAKGKELVILKTLNHR